MEIAHRLLVSKPAQDMSEAEATVFWQNFREDVAGMPAWGLALACERWRQDPARKYFPTGGELKDIVAADLEERLECYAHAKAILAYEPPKVEPYMTPERLKEIKEEMARDAERRNAARSEPSEGAGV